MNSLIVLWALWNFLIESKPVSGLNYQPWDSIPFGGHPGGNVKGGSVLSKEKRQRMERLFLDSDEFIPTVSKTLISFTDEVNGLLEVFKDYTSQLCIENGTLDAIEIELYCSNPSFDYDLYFEPSAFSLGSGKSMNVDVHLVMNCTCSVSFVFYIVCNSTQYAKFPVSAESCPSAYISPNAVSKDELIGEGGFGTVYKGVYKGTTVAVKELKSFGLSDPKIFSDIRREIALLNQLRSPYIVTCLGSMATRSKVMIVMEYCKYGTLTKLLRGPPLSRKMRLRLLTDVARGMDYLHRNSIIHRDLKPDNLLLVSLSLSAPVRVKISDFGSSRAVVELNGTAQNLTRGVGTPVYMAPEQFNGAQYSFPSDVYAYGMVSWEVWYQCPPYSNFTSTEAILSFVCSGHRPTVAESCPIRDLLASCWQQDPGKRPRFSEVVKELETVV